MRQVARRRQGTRSSFIPAEDHEVARHADQDTSGTTLNEYGRVGLLPAFRFGSFTFSRDGALYGICFRMCEMMLRRARRLSSEWATYHGPHLVSVARNMSSRARACSRPTGCTT